MSEEYGYFGELNLLPFQVKDVVSLLYLSTACCFLLLNKLCSCKICKTVDTNREIALEVENVLLETDEKTMAQKKNL